MALSMAHPPSYQEATRPRDWLELVAPYFPIQEYASLCRVSRRFYAQFAPRLWNDPLTTSLRLLLARNNEADLEWFYRFMVHVKGLEENTRALIHSLDLRAYVSGTSEFSIYAADSSSSPLTGTLRQLSCTFPELRCVLLDGHSDIDIGALAANVARGSSPLLLSVAQCQLQVPTTFFASPFLKNLVYLDLSDMPGSLKGPLVQQTLSPANLPNLRILKAQGREMDDSTASTIVRIFKEQLWSLDLSRNKVTDKLFRDLRIFSFPAERLRGGNVEAEGELQQIVGQGTTSFGNFCFVKESEWSKSFSHPDRYLADSPEYTHDNQETLRGNTARLDGRARIANDSADSVKMAFSGRVGYHPPSGEDIQDLAICQSSHGITHLHLNENPISSISLVKMIMCSPGQLQHLECDTTSLDIHDKALPDWIGPSSSFASATVSGILGAAHILRPVFSSNLQTLRVHHSLVTQLVTLNLPDLPTMTCLWLAETFLLPRAELAYPQAFMSDMNPRMRSLTLTHLPRRSKGPMIGKLIAFLKLCAVQEHAIQKGKSRTRRGPTTVEGLRHVRLEFDPDPLEDDYSDEDSDLDPEELIRLATKEFSFFGGSWEDSSPGQNNKTKSNKRAATDEVRHSAAQPPLAPASSVSEPRQDQDDESVRLGSGAQAPSPSSSSSSPLHYEGTWNGSEFKVQVFGGHDDAATATATPAVKEYMRILREFPALRQDLQPASPCHVAAGVPEGSYVFEAAWRAILTKDIKMRKPTRKELRAGMKDVIEEIRKFRVATRKDGRLGVHYGGVLEVVRK